MPCNLINECEKYAYSNSIVYNDKKPACMRIKSKNMKLHNDVNVTLNGKNIEYVTEHKYL